MQANSITVNGTTVIAGQRETIDLPLGSLYTHAPLSMPVHVICGKRPGPRLFISAAIHGDELNGVEIIRRLIKDKVLKRLQGTLVAIPVVNVHGLLHQSRYLPDRRDLNRSFPGSDRGSLAARVANIFMQEIVSQCSHGIDIHTGAIHRSNLPQIRANLDDDETARLAHAFGVPVILNSNIRDGSLREASAELGLPMLLYEAGEALRFDEVAIRAGVRGIKNVMRELDMLPPSRRKRKETNPVVARSSSWVRASDSGVFRSIVELGKRVEKGRVLGVISDPFGETEFEIKAAFEGIIIGCNRLPLVNEGDALFHLARFRAATDVEEKIDEFQEDYHEELLDSPVI
ncbi:MAG: succinylglutamate desuccinylase/aspartoacylase family protein [Gammaproteobacteria bacterium]|nr:succinylglutamate desuccinylase/aspartoacylase family protein [Gammaproteobacteria bacterium]MDH5777784.1 succinylglutamate desuccinylase/aspartoacylase family protein [Gammaproteobacteria bacterium]